MLLSYRVVEIKRCEERHNKIGDGNGNEDVNGHVSVVVFCDCGCLCYFQRH